ncbi:mechanosensitive ion channel family protein [candidate division KSB1 bacterium]|nr:mechanosensitive ion channel family protein [candidate division KSB1 bacterium]
MNFSAWLDKIPEGMLGHLLNIVIILILAFIGLHVVSIVAKRLTRVITSHTLDVEAQKRAETLSSVIRHILTVMLILVAAAMVLGELDIEIGPVLAAAGIVGLAIGFGAQSLVKDVINGFFILLEDQIRVGDVVEIAGKAGLVEKVNLKLTILRDLEGKVHFIPNGQIDTVTNMTKGFSRFVFDIGVAYREDIDQVIELIKRVDESLRNDPEFADDILQPAEILGLDKFANSALIVKGFLTTKPIKQWRVGREFNRRIKKIFDQNDIEIPFPHVTLYMGQDKAGMAPPLYVQQQKKDA